MSASPTNSAWQQAKLLNAYYRKVGRAAVGQGACPHFETFQAGYDPELVGPPDEQGRPTVADIPMKLAEVKNPFYLGTVDSAFSEDTALCVCEIPKGAASEPVQFNVVGLYDQDGELVAAAATLVDWLTPDELDRTYLSVTFPIEDEEE